MHQGVTPAPNTGRGGKEPTPDSLRSAKSAEKRWAQPATFGSLQMAEGVEAWERAKQLPPFLCPSPPENEGSVSPAAEEVWGGAGRGSHLGVTMLPPWGRTRVTCWPPLLSRDKAQRLSTPGPPPALPHRLHRAGWRWHAGPSTHARHRVLVLDDDLPQEAPLIVLVHSEAGRQGLPAVLSSPGRPGGERGRGQHRQTAAPWSLVTTGYPGQQPSPPATWGLPPGA